jgi:hypothetical protein
MAAGPAFGNINYEENNNNNEVKGKSWGFDLQIGGQ